MMEDLDSRVRRLIDGGASRAGVKHFLEGVDAAAKRQARGLQGNREDRDRARNATQTVDRVGRLLFFLHHGTPAQGATSADRDLYVLFARLE